MLYSYYNKYNSYLYLLEVRIARVGANRPSNVYVARYSVLPVNMYNVPGDVSKLKTS